MPIVTGFWSFSKRITLLSIPFPKVKDQKCSIIFYTPVPSGGVQFGFKKVQSELFLVKFWLNRLSVAYSGPKPPKSAAFGG